MARSSAAARLPKNARHYFPKLGEGNLLIAAKAQHHMARGTIPTTCASSNGVCVATAGRRKTASRLNRNGLCEQWNSTDQIPSTRHSLPAKSAIYGAFDHSDAETPIALLSGRWAQTDAGGSLEAIFYGPIKISLTLWNNSPLFNRSSMVINFTSARRPHPRWRQRVSHLQDSSLACRGRPKSACKRLDDIRLYNGANRAASTPVPSIARRGAEGSGGVFVSEYPSGPTCCERSRRPRRFYQTSCIPSSRRPSAAAPTLSSSARKVRRGVFGAFCQKTRFLHQRWRGISSNDARA